jgi:Uma2 family endonuclease
VKAKLYARHAIPEFWLLDVRGRRLTRYRDAASRAYLRIDEPDLERPVEIGRLPGVGLDLANVFVDRERGLAGPS